MAQQLKRLYNFQKKGEKLKVSKDHCFISLPLSKHEIILYLEKTMKSWKM